MPAMCARPGPGPGWPVAGRAAITLNSSRVSVAAQELGIHASRLGVNGSLTFPSDLSVTYALRMPDLGEAAVLLADAGLTAPPLALHGVFGGRGQLTGRLPEWHLDTRLSTQGLAVEEIDVDLDTTF